MSNQSGKIRLSDFVGRELTWKQPRALKKQYELRAGDRLLGTLKFRSIFGSFATGEIDNGCWTFKRTGFLRTKVTVRSCGSETDIAVFKNATWRGGGTLEFSDGRQLQATTNLWQSKLEYKTKSGGVLLSLKTRGVLRLSATAKVDAKAAAMPELPWVLMLGWYLIVMMHDDGATAASAAAAG